jgi:glycosyltransferase involved in cell wall biosynthesis
MIKLSIIIPVYNSENSIELLVNNIQQEFVHDTHEIILINDCSKDTSAEICKRLSMGNNQIKFISLRKNFGEFNAVMCGLNYAKGLFSVIIDDDFQNPPSEIRKLLDAAEMNDFDVVYSYYHKKKHSFFRNAGSKFINFLNSYLLNKPQDLYLSSFKLIRKEVVEEIIKYKGPYPYIDGLIFRTTNSFGKVLVNHVGREHGQSNYTLRKLFSLSMSIIFGYSLIPIRLTFIIGVLAVFFSFIFFIALLLGLSQSVFIPTFLFSLGFISCNVALLGEYMGKNYMTLNGTPQYIIKEKIIH